MCVQILNACVCVCLKVLIISTIPLHVRKITYITGVVFLKTQVTYNYTYI